MNLPPISFLRLVEELILDAQLGLVALPQFRRRTAMSEIWYELSLCITSSQERTSKALAAASALASAYDLLRKSESVAKDIAEVFSRHFITLRFVNRKIEHLAASFSLLHENQDVVVQLEDNFLNAQDARDFFISTFPGVGPKQASMFLRNLGWGQDLAIIDTHIARVSRVLLNDSDITIEADYLKTEAKLKHFAEQRNISLQTLDVILWSCARITSSRRSAEPLLV